MVESFGPFVEVQGFWKREDFWGGRAPLESELQLGLSASFRNNIGGFLTYSRDDYNYARGDYEGLFSGVSPVDAAAFAPSQALFSGLQSVRLRSWISPWERIRVSLGASWSETPIFERTTGTPADLADSWSGDLRVTFRPSGRFSAEVGGRHVTLLRKRDGSTYSSATIPRLQARYQFSRALFTRVIGEYSSQERGAVLDPSTGQPLYVCSEDCRGLEGSDRYDFRVEALLGYEPSPGTVFFVGYSRDWRDTQSFRFRDITSRSEGLFVKLSYRYRM